jgi:hypothetical protein
MATYERVQGQVRRHPAVTRHSRLQRHRTAPLGSGYAEEFELACCGYRDDPGRIAARSHPRFGGATGLTGVNGNGSSIHLPSTTRSRPTRTTPGSILVRGINQPSRPARDAAIG